MVQTRRTADKRTPPPPKRLVANPAHVERAQIDSSPPQALASTPDIMNLGLVDGLVRDVFYAGRSIRRAPLVSLTIVTTVALGPG